MSDTADPAVVEHERPWLRFYDPGVPASLNYPACTLFGALVISAAQRPQAIAWEFAGRRQSYAELVDEIEACARALSGLGLVAGDRLLVALPTVPHAVVALYAAARIGVVSAFIHPLSTSAEISHYLDATGAEVVLGLDLFYPALAAAAPRKPIRHLLLGRIGDYLGPLQRLAFRLLRWRMIPRIPADPRLCWWRPALAVPGPAPEVLFAPADSAAVILFSGGTTDLPKGIVLSHRAIIAQGMQAAAWGRLTEADSILAILPVFHGFGLGVCINAALIAGGRSLLVPRFDPAEVARLIRRLRPNVLVGVPTLFDALARAPALEGIDLSFLKAAFCGADTLPRPVKEAFEARIRAGGGNVRLLEGYGLTEAVTAIMAMPGGHYREGSIGLPFPDMLAKICRPGSEDTVADGEEGEICLAGPSLMLGYLDAPAATARALRRHADGRRWLHTGDLGRRDGDGFFYFSVRLKRIIKSSGFNVYPAQVEAVLQQHPAVAAACVIGLPDAQQIERVVAVVVAADPAAAKPELAAALIEHCRAQLIKWSCPREIHFRAALPTTRVGKIDYRALTTDLHLEASTR
jgi:long-chain acyl-CoA synthetase